MTLLVISILFSIALNLCEKYFPPFFQMSQLEILKKWLDLHGNALLSTNIVKVDWERFEDFQKAKTVNWLLLHDLPDFLHVDSFLALRKVCRATRKLVSRHSCNERAIGKYRWSEIKSLLGNLKTVPCVRLCFTDFCSPIEISDFWKSAPSLTFERLVVDTTVKTDFAMFSKLPYDFIPRQLPSCITTLAINNPLNHSPILQSLMLKEWLLGGSSIQHLCVTNCHSFHIETSLQTLELSDCTNVRWTKVDTVTLKTHLRYGLKITLAECVHACPMRCLSIEFVGDYRCWRTREQEKIAEFFSTGNGYLPYNLYTTVESLTITCIHVTHTVLESIHHLFPNLIHLVFEPTLKSSPGLSDLKTCLLTFFCNLQTCRWGKVFAWKRGDVIKFSKKRKNANP